MLRTELVVRAADASKELPAGVVSAKPTVATLRLSCSAIK